MCPIAAGSNGVVCVLLAAPFGCSGASEVNCKGFAAPRRLDEQDLLLEGVAKGNPKAVFWPRKKKDQS